MADDDFVQSILCDRSPLVATPPRARTRSGGGPAREGMAAPGRTTGPLGSEEFQSYGSSGEREDPGADAAGAPSMSHVPHTGAGLNTSGHDDVLYTDADVHAAQEALAGGGESFLHSLVRAREKQISASFAFNKGEEDESADEEQHALRNYAMFRYALLFINFTFVVAALLMIMAGVVARMNSALQLCSACGQISLASIVLGGLQWLLALFAFNWIRERNILFLLGYVVAVLVITVCLLGIFIAGAAFSLNLNDLDRQNDFLTQWENDINTTDSRTGENKLCQVQLEFNCSGFFYGCCDPTAAACGWNGTEPSWAPRVCPKCDFPPAPRICTGAITQVAQRNLGGFVVITLFSIILATTGIALAAFSRRITK